MKPDFPSLRRSRHRARPARMAGAVRAQSRL